MKVYIETPPGLSRAMDRVVKALKAHAPSNIEFVQGEMLDADLVVLHVIGFPETEAAVNMIRLAGKKYAIIQYCLRTTQEPDSKKWMDIWKGAEVVWSYYDLIQALTDDGVAGATGWMEFYYAPLGISSSFTTTELSGSPRRYKVMTTGYVAQSESIGEIADAVVRTDGAFMYHLGNSFREMGLTPNRRCVEMMGIPDATLCQIYDQTQYVTGLRRVEGFEMPVIEGMSRGCRPIVFDRPHYRQWFGDWAIYIKEGTPEEVTEDLVGLFSGKPVPLSVDQINDVRRQFSWERIAGGFWAYIQTPVVYVPKTKRKMLWIGDAGVSTGFAKSTHKILETVARHYDVHVLALNYNGDSKIADRYPYPLYSCWSGGDAFGLGRVRNLLEQINPDVCVVQNDPWNFPAYLRRLGNVSTVGIVAVDGLNCQGNKLAGLKLAVFWTEFAYEEARRGGYTGLACVIPLGIDRTIFKPGSRDEARRATLGNKYSEYRDSFIFMNVNRNQPRKRLDLTLQYFAEWVHKHQIPDAMLSVHLCPTGDDGYDIPQLAGYYGIANRIIFEEPELGHGVPEMELAKKYQSADCGLSTTQGEGFGLTTFEMMACGIAQIVPGWSALGEICQNAAHIVPCTTTIATDRKINVIGGVPDRRMFIEGLDKMYRDKAYREDMALKGFARATEDRFDWEQIGNQFINAIAESMRERSTPVRELAAS